MEETGAAASCRANVLFPLPGDDNERSVHRFSFA
jgi:hypothetical protein